MTTVNEMEIELKEPLIPNFEASNAITILPLPPPLDVLLVLYWPLPAVIEDDAGTISKLLVPVAAAAAAALLV